MLCNTKEGVNIKPGSFLACPSLLTNPTLTLYKICSDLRRKNEKKYDII